MKAFSELVFDLALCSSPEEKVRIIIKFLEQSLDNDILCFLSLFLHKKPKRVVLSRTLRGWAIEFGKIKEWLFEECQNISNDLNETISLIVPKNQPNVKKSFSEWIFDLTLLHRLNEVELKEWVLKAWAILDEKERTVLNKLLVGGFRTNVSLNTISTALSEHLSLDKSSVAHRLIKKWSPLDTTFQELFFSEDKNDLLAKPLTLKKTIKLNSSLENLGDTNEWIAEWKWDGFRSQLISREGEVFIWSSHIELLNPFFPEIINAKIAADENFVLDGVLVAYEDGIPLAFSSLEKRMGKKNITKALIKEFPVAFIAIDILEHNEEDLRAITFDERRVFLENLCKKNSDDLLVLSELVPFKHWKDLHNQTEEARFLKVDGLILKNKNASYYEEKDWLKWKVEPLTIDAVLIYAHRSSGWSMQKYNEFSFALWQADKLITFARIKAEIDEDEMAEISQFVKLNTIERFGPVYSISPELVFRLSFDGIQESKRHKSGIAIRNPKIVEWLKDTDSKEANSLTDVRTLLT